MPEAAKLDRRGGWFRSSTSRHNPPTARQEAPGDPIAFINSLTHIKGPFAAQGFNLRPWQRAFLRKLFRKGKDGKRQYRTCLLMLPRKNGKSELAAALAVYALMRGGENGAEVYSAAADRDQAGLVFGVAAQMIRNDTALDSECYILESQKRIVHRPSGSFYRAISAEAHSKHGFNASMVIYDELHSAPNRHLYDVLSTSFGGRDQPLMLIISTAGYDRHSILWELYTHAKKVQEHPALDPTFLPLLYEAPEDADWTDEKVWRKCNPALGDFRSLEDMRIQCKRAQQVPAQENVFRRLYLNQWTETFTPWVPMPAWDACKAPIDRASLRGKRCYVGMDLSATTDLTALVAVFPDADGRHFAVLPHFFLPADRLRERGDRDHVPYVEWQRQGHLTTCPGVAIDNHVVRHHLHGWAKEFVIAMIGFDTWGAREMQQYLEEVDRLPLVDIKQSFAGLSSPTKQLEKKILERDLRHDGNPMLRWNVSNVAVEQDHAGAVRPNKAASTARIDGVVALIMAVDVMDRHHHKPQPTYRVRVLG